MARRYQTFRPAQTASAREAMRSFFCELCQKGYTRMNEYEAHLSSYDHAHKQRLRDMKAMVRDPAVTARARRLEAKAADAVISIKLSGAAGDDGSGEQPATLLPLASKTAAAAATEGASKKGGFRKGGFRSAFAEAAPAAEAEAQIEADDTEAGLPDPALRSMPAIALPPVSSGSSTSHLRALPPPLAPAGTMWRTDESDTDDEDYEMYDPARPTE